MTSLKELLASEGCKKGRKRSSVAADRGAERKGAACEYRLVSNERSIDIYEEVSSEIGVRTERHAAWGKSQKQLTCKYNKSYSNPIYEDEIIYSRYFENTVKSSYCAPSLKEAAIQAVVLILTGHVQCFATEGAFRALLHQSCAVCLARDGKLFADLKEVIVLIERIVSFGFDLNQLNNASLKLKELIYGATDSRLLACANLYLGIVYKLLRKEKASAKHLLKVFVCLPFQSRIHILPELWDRLFAPHLSHFKLWYDKEVGSLVIAPSWEKRMKSIYKTYNDLVNKGTHDLAMYYLKWIKGEEKGLCEIAYLHGRENELLLRKLARESFKPQQVLHG
ncbi:putative E3 ubiquitin-protein ligase LIN-1 [Carex littledalei]|uniref:Putative E3 ubiquitin-protein ligase LIN-1 n=1 Tax=Carex littledalei TaxID=544730 RepID=A0A833R130_9POAL|nr:putative E3 ubiquitin-protein ligase LIN-1 [Carex littledalei]